MKKLTFLLAILIQIPSLFALTWEKTNIEITPKPGETAVTAYFKFTNNTDAPVSIKKAFSSCSTCTDLVWEEKAYDPGESGDLIAVVKLTGLNGKKVKYLTIETTEKSVFPDRLSLTVVLPEQLALTEKRLRWDAADKSTKSVKIKSAIKDAVPVIAEISPNEIFNATITAIKDAPGEYQLSINPTDSSSRAKRAIVKIAITAPDGNIYYEDLSVSKL